MNSNCKKSPYQIPVIEQVNIDNEISLILVSGNPGNPSEQLNKTPEFYNAKPVMDGLV